MMSKNESDPPDLDLIQMVQRARMMHDAEAKPSQVSAVYWIEAKCEINSCQQPTPRAGQWILNTTLHEVDDLWEIIRAATVSGKLGYKSKVSTASRSGTRPDSRTLAVCTYDAADQADVDRVQAALHQLTDRTDWVYQTD